MDKEKIKGQANIDIFNLRMAQKQGVITEFGKGKLEALEGIVDFIDSMQEEPVSEELEEAAFDYAEACKCDGGEKLLCVEHFKAGAKWQKEKDKSVTKDLGDYINELSKQFPEVSFAKLSRIAVRVAKWKERQLMANAVEGVLHHFEKCKVASVHYNDPTGVPMAYFTSPEGLSAGDKVKIIINKED